MKNGQKLNSELIESIFGTFGYVKTDSSTFTPKGVVGKDEISLFLKNMTEDVDINHSADIPSIGQEILERQSTIEAINADIMTFVPELEQTKMILGPTIMSPDNFNNSSIMITLSTNSLGGLESEKIIDYIRKNFVDRHELETKLPIWINRSFFQSGSSPILVLPSDIIEPQYTRATESFDMSSLSSEEVNIDSGMCVLTNDLSKLKHLASEGASLNTTSDGLRFIAVDTNPTNGYIMTSWPAGALIPLIVNGDPTNHNGYLAVVGSDGKPISTASKSTSDVLQTPSTVRYSKLFGGAVGEETGVALRSILGQMLGKHKDTKDLTVNEDTYIMTTIAQHVMRGNQVSFIYIPSNYVGYFAFDYRDDGTGRSLPETVRQFGTMRMVSLVCSVAADIDQAVSRKIISIDGKGVKSANMVAIADALRKSASGGFGLTSTFDPNRIISSLRYGSIEVIPENFEGNSGVKVSYEAKQGGSGNQIADSRSIETLTKMINSKLPIPPSMLDPDRREEFARGITVNSLFLSNLASGYQKVVNRDTTKLLRAMLINSNSFHKFVKEVLPEADISTLISQVSVKLPEPKVAKANSQIDAMRVLAEKIELTVNSSLPDELFVGDRENEDTFKRYKAMVHMYMFQEAVKSTLPTGSLFEIHPKIQTCLQMQDFIIGINQFKEAINRTPSASTEEGDSSGGSNW